MAAARLFSVSSLDRHRRPPLRLGLALLTPLLVTGCCTRPRADELSTRFRTPEETIATFQRGMRADLPAIEFQCLSVELVQRYGLSELAYREFRQVSGWVRAGVARARIEERVELSSDRVRIALATSGPLGLFPRRLSVDLVREAFWEAYAGERRVVDELAGSLEELLEVAEGSYGPVLVGAVPLPAHLDPRAGAEPITELRIGREWKIADLRLPGAPEPPARALARAGWRAPRSEPPPIDP